MPVLAVDVFSDNAAGLSSPVTNALAITPSDTDELAQVTRGVYVAVSGTLKVDMVDSGTVTFTALSAGVIHPIRCKKIYSTGTAATGIVAVW